MIEVFLNQVLPVVFSEDFNLAAEVVVGALYQLILAHIPVLLNILSEDFRAALVVALDDLKQTPLIVSLQILEHDH